MDRTTPTGIQCRRDLDLRRLAFAALALATYLAMCAAMARIADAGGWTIVDIAMLLAFAVAVPWSVVGFWNTVIAVWELSRGAGRRWSHPFATPPRRRPRTATAVVMTLRNEHPERALARLRAVLASLDDTGFGSAFQAVVLSDTDEAALLAREEELVAALDMSRGNAANRLVYRRRPRNVGFKGGNIADFCGSLGSDFSFMLLLDADSLMTGETILDLVLLAEEHPRLGIAQTLPVGLPARAPFPRLFQFGMRYGLRIYMAGAAWWTADCGSYWGHNALVRVAPFIAHCGLPTLPGSPPWGGAIMAHDQVEAALMRRAGFEVRVFALAGGSFEDAPPDLIAHTTRDLRWCQGNLQYWRLLATPGLALLSRFQLVWAATMFYAMPAWNIFLLLAALRPFTGAYATAFPADLAIGLYGCVVVMGPSPKLAGYLMGDLDGGGVLRNGVVRFACGCVAELAFSFMVKAVTEFRVSLFIVGLVFGRSVIWSGQSRDAHGLSWRAAAAVFWPCGAFAILVLALLAAGAPWLIVWTTPITAGLLLAIPLAVLTASPRAGAWCSRWGVCTTAEEVAPPLVLQALSRDGGTMSTSERGRPSTAFPDGVP